MSYSGKGLQWDVRPSCVLQGGFNGAINNEVKPRIRIFISSHTGSSTLGLETILLTPGPTMRKYSAFVPSRLTIPLLARCWFEISKKEKAVFCGNFKLTDFFSMCSQYFAFHQLGDLQLRDLVEPVMPGDWDRYFPDGVQNQYCMSLFQDQATD